MSECHVITGDNTELYIKPIFDVESWEFISAVIKEGLFDNVAMITITLHCDELPCAVDDEIEGYITDYNGNQLSFAGFVDSVNLVNKTGTIDILCCPQDLVKPIVTSKYTKIDDAITSTLSGMTWRKESAAFESDILSMTDPDYAYYQTHCTNKQLCDELRYSYRKDIISGFTLEDMVMCDLMNWASTEELHENNELTPIGSPKVFKPKFYEQEAKIVDYSSGKDPNHKLLDYYSQLIPVDTQYVDLVGNTLYQRRYDTPIMTNTFKMKQFRAYKLGQGFDVISTQYEYKEPWLVSRVIEINDNDLTTTLTFNCYKQ